MALALHRGPDLTPNIFFSHILGTRGTQPLLLRKTAVLSKNIVAYADVTSDVAVLGGPWEFEDVAI